MNKVTVPDVYPMPPHSSIIAAVYGGAACVLKLGNVDPHDKVLSPAIVKKPVRLGNASQGVVEPQKRRKLTAAMAFISVPE